MNNGVTGLSPVPIFISQLKLNVMNYMINDNASRIVAIEFAKWVVLNGMWQSDLSFEEMYECWMRELDDQAYDDRVAHDSIDADYECWVDEMDEGVDIL